MEEHSDRTETAKFFSDISRNTGKVTFVVRYSATEGNVEIDKKFQEFCFKYANNEYLQGIGLLLQGFEHYKQILALDGYVQNLDARVTALEEELKAVKSAAPKIEEPKKKADESKTF